MKTILTICITLLAAACGSPTDVSPTKTTAPAAPNQPSTVAEATDLSASFVRLQAAETAILDSAIRRTSNGLVTDVTIGVAMGCLDRLANIASSTTTHGRKAKIRVSAHTAIHKRSHLVRCATAYYSKRTFSIQGAFKKANIELLSLDSPESVPLLPGDIGVSALSNVYPLSAGLLCPPNPGGMTCLAIGSKVTIKVLLNGCRDRLGPVAYRFEEKANGQVALYIKALNIANEHSPTTRCIVAPVRTFTLNTPLNISNVTDVRVHVLN